MKFGLNNSVIDKINFVFERYDDIEKVLVYGSRSIGDYRNGSDNDLSIQGGLSERNFYDILHELDNLNLTYMTDVSQFEALGNKNLIDHINRKGQIFYEHKKVLQ